MSCIGLGGSHLGEAKDLQTAIRIVRTAVDNGVDFMDNCWDYHEGRSEDWMGQALGDGYRNKVFLMSKIDGRDKQTASKQIDESLRRLRTDRLDLMQMHEMIRMSDPDAIFSEGGGMEALLEAKNAGKIRYIGFTGHKDPKIHMATLKKADEHDFTFDTVQLPLNAMDAHYNSFEKTVLPELVQRNIGVLGMKPMGSGDILKSGSVTAVECLQYALNLPASVVITGCETVERLEQALQVARSFKKLDGAQVSAMLAKTRPKSDNGEFELYKTTTEYDGTTKHPEWLGEAVVNH